MRAVSVLFFPSALSPSILSIMGPQCTAPDYTGVTPAIHNGFLFVRSESGEEQRRRTSEGASDAQGGRGGPKLRQEGREGNEGGRRKKKLLEMVLEREGGICKQIV